MALDNFSFWEAVAWIIGLYLARHLAPFLLMHLFLGITNHGWRFWRSISSGGTFKGWGRMLGVHWLDVYNKTRGTPDREITKTLEKGFRDLKQAVNHHGAIVCRHSFQHSQERGFPQEGDDEWQCDLCHRLVVPSREPGRQRDRSGELKIDGCIVTDVINWELHGASPLRRVPPAEYETGPRSKSMRFTAYAASNGWLHDLDRKTVSVLFTRSPHLPADRWKARAAVSRLPALTTDQAQRLECVLDDLQEVSEADNSVT